MIETGRAAQHGSRAASQLFRVDRARRRRRTTRRDSRRVKNAGAVLVAIVEFRVVFRAGLHFVVVHRFVVIDSRKRSAVVVTRLGLVHLPTLPAFNRRCRREEEEEARSKHPAR